MNNNRITNPSTVCGNRIREIVESGQVPTIQFSRSVYTREVLRDLNRLCIEFEDLLQIRFYGHYEGHFDASALADLPDVRWLSLDCLTAITNEHQIEKLPLLERFSFGVFRFDDPGFLGKIGVGKLKQLTLGENARRNLDLASLEASSRLTKLFVNGHTKNIDVISALPELRNVTLSAFSKHKELHFLCHIDQLQSLTLLLGGRSSIDEFSHPSLEELNIVRVRGLESVGSLQRFPRLRSLRIEDQLQVRSIDLAGAPLALQLQFWCVADRLWPGWGA